MDNLDIEEEKDEDDDDDKPSRQSISGSLSDSQPPQDQINSDDELRGGKKETRGSVARQHEKEMQKSSNAWTDLESQIQMKSNL